MKAFLSSAWYNFQSIPYLAFAIIFICAILFVYIAPKFIAQIKWLHNIWIAIPVVFILSIGFSSNLIKFIDYTRKAGISSEAERKELKTMLNLTNTDNKILRIEIENLRHAALNVQTLSNIKEVNLLETDMTSTIAHTENFDDEPNKLNTGSHGKQFWLVSQYNLKGIKYGIDLEKIKVALENDKIVIYGIEPKYNGIEHKDEPINVLCEVRRYDSENGILKNEKVLYDAVSLAKRDELVQKYHEIDMERIEKTTDQFEWINSLVEKYAHEFIESFLYPLGKEIVYIKTTEDEIIPETALSLESFYNQNFSKVVK